MLHPSPAFSKCLDSTIIVLRMWFTMQIVPHMNMFVSTWVGEMNFSNIADDQYKNMLENLT